MPRRSRPASDAAPRRRARPARPDGAAADRLGVAPARGADEGGRLAHAIASDGVVVRAEQPGRQLGIRASPLAEPEPAPRELRMLEQGSGLMPAGHDGARFPLEQLERARGIDDLLAADAPAARDGRQSAEHEAPAPEER